MLNTIHYCALPLGADLLSALKGHEGKLEVMGSLLQGRLLARLLGRISYSASSLGVRVYARTRVACIAASFFKSSDPRFAIARVDSVKSWLSEILSKNTTK